MDKTPEVESNKPELTVEMFKTELEQLLSKYDGVATIRPNIKPTLEIIDIKEYAKGKSERKED